MPKFKILIILFSLALSCHALAEQTTVPTQEIDLLIHTDEVKIGGTLSLPQKKNSDKLVVMLSGSGPQDRDETLDGFKVFKTLTARLSAQGIASFRFDDRGVGESTGVFNTSTLADHSTDVDNIIDYFRTHPQYTFSEVILLGHSQGGIVSAHVAASNEAVTGVILMGAPAVPLVDIVLYQVRLEHTESELSRAQIEAEVSAHNQLMWAISQDTNLDKARHAFSQSTKTILSVQQPKQPDINALAAEKIREFEVIYALPSLTSFLYHDTAEDYARLDVPVLSLFGGKDLQVTIDQNKDIMEMALLEAGVPYTFDTFDQANHYFQAAVTGHRDEYETLDKRFVEGFPARISNWILAQ